VARYRALPLGGSITARFTPRADGSTLVRSTEALQPYPDRLTDRLLHWAAVAPDRTLAAKREHGGDWRRISYAQALAQARSIAQALIDMRLSAEHPVVVLSDNDLEHLLIAWGRCSRACLTRRCRPRIRCSRRTTASCDTSSPPCRRGLVFASSGGAFGKAINATVSPHVPVVLTSGTIEGRTTMRFDELLAITATDAVDAAHARVGPDTIAKFLFTSGSTKLPKAGDQHAAHAVQQPADDPAVLFRRWGQTPPVLVDWLPWNHTFGSNHNVGLTIYNGGTIYIDEGKPTPALIGETLRNLREIAPTVYFNVPKGFGEWPNALESTRRCARSSSAASACSSLPAPACRSRSGTSSTASPKMACGERIRMLTGLGMTETAPFAICANAEEVKSGHIGLPVPGMELKLVPQGDKTEVRYRGPNVTSGYWRSPEQTAESFDDEGFYCSGDAVKPIEPGHPEARASRSTPHRRGLQALDRHLPSRSGPLRARVIAAGDPCVQDVVVAGINRDELGLLIFPSPMPAARWPGCRPVPASPR